MQLDQLKSRQEAILDELFYASQLPNEEYKKSKWSVKGTITKLLNEYRELQARINTLLQKT